MTLQTETLVTCLDREAQIKRSTDGAFNTTVGDMSDPQKIFRISKGSNTKFRHENKAAWLQEANATQLLGDIGVAPRVYEILGGDLTEKMDRVAMRVKRYSLNLNQALFPSNPKSPLGRLSLKIDFGEKCGRMLILRICQMGSMCIIHLDIKPRNTMLLLKLEELEQQVQFKDLRFIDFDPRTILAGCDTWTKLGGAFVSFYKSGQELDFSRAFCSIINLGLMWLLFMHMQLEKRDYMTPAANECYAILTKALNESSLCLSVAAPYMRHLEELLQKFADHYTPRLSDQSLISRLQTHFPMAFVIKNASAPRVAGFQIRGARVCCSAESASDMALRRQYLGEIHTACENEDGSWLRRTEKSLERAFSQK
jgi:hypothetical protein